MNIFGLSKKSAIEQKAHEQLDTLAVAAQATADAMSSLAKKIVNGGIHKHEARMCKSFDAWRACPFGGLEVSGAQSSNIEGPQAPAQLEKDKMG